MDKTVVRSNKGKRVVKENEGNGLRNLMHSPYGGEELSKMFEGTPHAGNDP
jgi:hypothetical protein